MKTIYKKTYEHTYRNYAYVWREKVICPKCHRGMMDEILKLLRAVSLINRIHITFCIKIN